MNFSFYGFLKGIFVGKCVFLFSDDLLRFEVNKSGNISYLILIVDILVKDKIVSGLVYKIKIMIFVVLYIIGNIFFKIILNGKVYLKSDLSYDKVNFIVLVLVVGLFIIVFVIVYIIGICLKFRL